jgi:hypothetical protein
MRRDAVLAAFIIVLLAPFISASTSTSAVKSASTSTSEDEVCDSESCGENEYLDVSSIRFYLGLVVVDLF